MTYIISVFSEEKSNICNDKRERFSAKKTSSKTPSFIETKTDRLLIRLRHLSLKHVRNSQTI